MTLDIPKLASEFARGQNDCEVYELGGETIYVRDKATKVEVKFNAYDYVEAFKAGKDAEFFAEVGLFDKNKQK